MFGEAGGWPYQLQLPCGKAHGPPEEVLAILYDKAGGLIEAGGPRGIGKGATEMPGLLDLAGATNSVEGE